MSTSDLARARPIDAPPGQALDRHGPDWRQWVLGNLGRGCAPLDMVADMVAKVWSFEDASSAIDEGLVALKLPGHWRPAQPTFPASNHLLLSDGRQVSVLARFRKPRIVLMGGVLTATECSELISYAVAKGLSRSVVVEGQTGDGVGHEGRTSSSVCMTRAESPLIETLERRLCEITGWPLTHGEGLQVLQYAPGQEYRPHFDWFDPAHPGSASHLATGGQRVATTVVYLKVPDSGGGTTFPSAGVEVLPPVGGAVFFQDVDVLGRPDAMTLHGGLPVDVGLKVVATYWQREGPFQAAR
jgi:prolyl 4-hydroxylase